MAPTQSSTKEVLESTRKQDFGITITSQRWHRSGSCRKGTIPIRRIPKDFLNKNGYGRKMPRQVPTQLSDKRNFLTNHSLAVLITEGMSYVGGKADIKVWWPYIESEDDYSLSQLTLQTGPYYDCEAIESGWAVNPGVYKDHQTRFYVYWTLDASRTTGCFDLTCPGFVQVSHEIALGGAIYPISNPNGLPYQIIVHIYKDSKTDNWWVRSGESIEIGYWPKELFERLWYNAVLVKWGGEVYSPKVNTHHPHTATHMGNGRFPTPILENCGTMKRMRIQDNSEELKIPEWTDTDVDEYYCYNIMYLSDYVDDPVFYYGGPGRGPMCP